MYYVHVMKHPEETSACMPHWPIISTHACKHEETGRKIRDKQMKAAHTRVTASTIIHPRVCLAAVLEASPGGGLAVRHNCLQ